jgi:hypothetical protein
MFRQFKGIFDMFDFGVIAVKVYGDYIEAGSAVVQTGVLQVFLSHGADGTLFFQRNRLQR